VARRHTGAASVADRVTFRAAEAGELEAGDFDLVTMFDCLPDMGDRSPGPAPPPRARYGGADLDPLCRLLIELSRRR
jgi:hypothetical protein